MRRLRLAAITLTLLVPSIVLAQSAGAAAVGAAPASEATTEAAPSLGKKAPKAWPRSIRFGREQVAASGQTSAVHNVTVLNPYAAAAPVALAGAPSLGGENPGDFAVAQNQCPVSPATLKPGDQCTVGITFTPTGSGKRSAELTLAFAGGAPPAVIKLYGKGIVPKIGVSPKKLKFADTTVGQSSSPQTLTIDNPSAVAVQISGVGVTGPFVADSSGCAMLAAGKNCTVSVIFKPVAEGKASGLLTLQADARGGEKGVSLYGVASKAP